MSSPLKVIICLIEILLLYFDLRDLIQCTRLKELVITHADNLLEVQDRIIVVIKFFQRLRFVKVGLAE
jgi:hypothetical protein